MTPAPLDPDRALLPERPAWLPEDAVLEQHYETTVRYSYYRIRTTDYVARLLPATGPCSVLDVGAGDGHLGAALQMYRPQTRVAGVEVQMRGNLHHRARVLPFDGKRLPFSDRAFDVSLLMNVLHHAGDKAGLLREVGRVTSSRVIVKDHWCESAVDRWLLAFLDQVGNRRFGASVTGDYLGQAGWESLFRAVGSPRVLQFHGLPFRQGLLATVFPNRLEILFVLERPQRPAASELSPSPEAVGFQANPSS